MHDEDSVCMMEFAVDVGDEQALLVRYNVIYVWHVVDIIRVHTFKCARWTLNILRGTMWTGIGNSALAPISNIDVM